MPYEVHKTDRCPTSKPWGVINPDNSRLMGCHASKEEAQAQQAALYRNVPDARSETVQHKTFDLVETKADGETGTFTALASVFNNVDLVGDRMMPGAFKRTLKEWRASKRPIPVIWTHQHDDPEAIIGKADPRSVMETDDGLLVQGSFDLENPKAIRIRKLMMDGLINGWSFGYIVRKGGQKKNEDGVNEVNDVDLFEVGPTFKGANPEARTEMVKSGLVDEKSVHLATLLRESALKLEQGEQVDWSEIFPDRELVLGKDLKLVDPAHAGVPWPDKATTAPWDGSASRFTDEQYARSCVLDRAKCGQTDLPTKQRYSLPIREPGGALNANAVHAAAARINQVQACAEAKAAAKAKLRGAYSQLGEEVPDSLKSSDVQTVEDAPGEEPSPAKSAAQDPLREKGERLILSLAEEGVPTHIEEPPVVPERKPELSLEDLRRESYDWMLRTME